MAEAILWRKQKKEEEIKSLEQKQRESENRQLLTAKSTYDLTHSLMLYRMSTVFNGDFKLDQYNTAIFEILCAYFGEDQKFISMSESIGVLNPSLNKGIFLAGNFGVGKTWLMKIFQKNQRQCYSIKNAKTIADEFHEGGEEYIAEYLKPKQNPINDASCFYQRQMGICIDDIGTEDLKNNYGNKKNVIGDLIEKKYSIGAVGILFHATSNLTAQQMKDFYGGRVLSRMKEIFNFIELKGSDRRK